jgi:hypothetical protein
MHYVRWGSGSIDTIGGSAWEHITLLHLLNRLAEHGLDRFQVCIRMGRRKKAGIPFLNMNTLFAHRVVKQTTKSCIIMERKVKPGREVMDPARYTTFKKETIELGR